eukprot:3882119-Amphidinium_carterae.1
MWANIAEAGRALETSSKPSHQNYNEHEMVRGGDSAQLILSVPQGPFCGGFATLVPLLLPRFSFDGAYRVGEFPAQAGCYLKTQAKSKKSVGSDSLTLRDMPIPKAKECNRRHTDIVTEATYEST